MNVFKKFFLFLLILPFSTFAQQNSQKEKERQKINDFFNENTPWKTTKDSSAAYAFSFKIIVVKDLHGVAKVISMTASDSLAYQIYPTYKTLETINYSVFMDGRKSAVFIIPVVIEIYSSKGKEIGRTDFLELSKSLFNFGYTEKSEVETHIYFTPVLMRLDKQVYD